MDLPSPRFFPKLALLTALGALLCPAHLAHSAPPAPDCDLLYADEFDGHRVNEHDWNFRTGPRTGIDGLNLARNVRVAAGHLLVIAKHKCGVGQVGTVEQPGETRCDYSRHCARDYPGAAVPANGRIDCNRALTATEAARLSAATP